MPEKATFEIGIHVTDVAHYVREKTTLDKVARERSYAIELVEQTIPILPSNFLESHCYLLPNRERLAFSILCRFTENGTLLHAWVGRSIVRSKGHIKHVDTGGEKSEIESDASILLNLCRKLQRNRMEHEHGLSLAKHYVAFKLGKSGYPEEITRMDEADEDVLMNELLIIANIEVGQKISSRFPDQALLYRQEQPKMSAFVSSLEKQKKNGTLIECYIVDDSKLLELSMRLCTRSDELCKRRKRPQKTTSIKLRNKQVSSQIKVFQCRIC